MKLYRALIEWVEARAEAHRETVAAKFLDCRCGCGALNYLDENG
jgi:hypothetical protein